MRKFNKSQVMRLWQERDVQTVRSNLLLPILIPIILMKCFLIGIVAMLIYGIVTVIPSAFNAVGHAIHSQKLGAKTGKVSESGKGGEVRQTGFQKMISTARHGEPARSGDLRRRLNELRSVGTGNPAHRPRKHGGQYGK